MAFLNGIFGQQNKPQQQQQPNQQQPQHPNQQQQPNGQQTPQQNSNGSGGPAGSQHSPQNSNYNPNGNPANPLDPFAQLMTPSKEVLEANKNNSQPQNIFGDQFTPDNINKAVGSTNFAANLDPARVQAALGGDSQAFMEVINQAVAAGVSTSIQASHGMVEHGVKTGTDRFGNSLDSRFRDYELRQQTSKNPALQHPVGKALLSTVAKQIAQANPRMSASEVSAKSEEMFSQFAQLMIPQTQAGDQNDPNAKPAMDWLMFTEDEPKQ